ncbi:MAG TPA: thiamine-phosphate kinase [Dehalococcoidia bacterium]
MSDLGEFELIRLLTREIGASDAGAHARPGILVDVGDDAFVTVSADGATVWTTDTLVAGVHFLEDVTPWRNTGWKAIAVNVSDVAAMGAKPQNALVTLSLPPEQCVEDVVELYRGMRQCSDAFGVTIGGGDIVRSPVFSVTVALSGSARLSPDGEPEVLRRGAACPGDAIATTGTLGDAAAGLRLLQSGASREDAANRPLIDAQERPQPRVAAGVAAVAAGILCGIDISDGLVQDLGHICEMSGVTARVDISRLPLSRELRTRFGKESVDLALRGGEDYELLLCGSRQALEAAGIDDLTVIGEIIGGPPAVRLVDGAGVEVHLESTGWDHLRGGPAS